MVGASCRWQRCLVPLLVLGCASRSASPPRAIVAARSPTCEREVRFTGPLAADVLAISTPRDVDGDGVADVLLGLPAYSGDLGGAAVLLSGASGEARACFFALEPPADPGTLGTAVALGPMLAFGSPSQGKVYLHDLHGGLVHTLHGSPGFGSYVRFAEPDGAALDIETRAEQECSSQRVGLGSWQAVQGGSDCSAPTADAPVCGAGLCVRHAGRGVRSSTDRGSCAGPRVREVFVSPEVCLPVGRALSQAGAELVAQVAPLLAGLADALEKGDARAISALVDPVEGLTVWTTPGSVTQPSVHVLPSGAYDAVLPDSDAHMLVELVREAARARVAAQSPGPVPEAALEGNASWAAFELRGVAKLLLLERARLLEDAAVVAAIERTPLAVELRFVRRDELRVELSARNGRVYAAQLLLRSSER
jgi:hypothetical protein